MKITEIFCIANQMITGSNPTLTNTFLIFFLVFLVDNDAKAGKYNVIYRWPLSYITKNCFFIDWYLDKVSHEIYFIAVVSNNSGVHLVDSGNFSNSKM